MNLFQVQAQWLARVCAGNADAMHFLTLWHEYVHAIDDIEDEYQTPGARSQNAEFRQRVYILALELYTTPFFRQHEARLKQVVLSVTNAYADVLAWERSEVRWHKDFVDVYRHFGAEMVVAVAQITGGYDHARGVSREQRILNYEQHHDEHGRPV